MVHQMSLVSCIPDSQHVLTLQTLQALTGMSPQQVDLHHVVLTPKYPFKPELQAGKVNQIEQYRIKLISTGNGSDFYKLRDKEQHGKLLNKEKNWVLQLSDIPIAGKKATCQQNIYETMIVDSGAHDDLLGYFDELGYKFDDEYWLKGEKFFYNSIIVEIFQIWTDKDKLLDETKNWFVKAYVTARKPTDLDVINKGNKELESFAKEVSGLLELVIPDRLSMDSRLNSIK